MYTKSGCCLCDEAKQVILQVVREYPADFEEVDVERDPELMNRYGEEIPVVFLNGSKLFKFRVDTERLRQAIRKRLGK